MKLLISLDYELFFGRRTGSVERCLIAPCDALCKALVPYAGKLSFFVDIGFVLRLKSEAKKSDLLRREYDLLCRHMERLVQMGHELQLHIHPHWEDSHWMDGNWKMDVRRYRLHDFADEEISSIVASYRNALAQFCSADSICAYRAGGWVVQPFDKLGPALAKQGIEIDSTVFGGGQSESDTHVFDFRNAPKRSTWRFDTDPMVPSSHGQFLEVPIASHAVGPGFYWKLALSKKLARTADRPFGDGSAIALGRSDLVKKLIQTTWSVVSIDGRKVDFLDQAFAKYQQLGLEDFVVIGHPKALTPHSISGLEKFLAKRRGIQFVNYQNYRSQPPIRASLVA